MFGTKRTIAFWRRKRPLLVLERALSPLGRSPAKGVAMTAPELAQARTRAWLVAEAKKKARFDER